MELNRNLKTTNFIIINNAIHIYSEIENKTD